MHNTVALKLLFLSSSGAFARIGFIVQVCWPAGVTLDAKMCTRYETPLLEVSTICFLDVSRLLAADRWTCDMLLVSHRWVSQLR